MDGARCVADGPPCTPVEALMRLADEPHLVLLHGGDGGWSHLAWGAPPRALAGWDDLSALERGAPGPLPCEPPGDGGDHGWSGRFPGGHVIQLDYEFPAVPGRAWPVDAWVSWDRAGRCRLQAADAAGLARLRAGLARAPAVLAAPALAGALRPAWDAAGHATRVERIRALIAAGDAYQANLTLPFHGRLVPGAHRDLALFGALCAASPAPFAALLRGGPSSVVSNSPECFLRVADGVARSEPIKGTRRRRPGHETAVRAELLAAPKDRAELAMIVDLVRNDLGRCAAAGGVSVDDPAAFLDLPYVHHLVARISARLAPGMGASAVARAAFPAGSVTGAPKIRAMQIIRELEAGPRGAYCGSFGWIAAGGAELAVAIRTLVVDGDQVRLDAGGGIVAESDPAAEWDEVRAKAAAMAAALGASL